MTDKKRAKKEKITLSAYDLLLEKGVNSFSINQLLENINMSKGNFYHYFKNKDELLYEVISLKVDLLTKKYEKKNKNETFKDKLNSLFFFYSSKDEEIEEFFNLSNQMYFLYLDKKDSFLYTYLKGFYKNLYDNTQKLLELEVEKGNLKKEILFLSKPIVATVDGMMTQHYLLKDYDIQEELDKYFSFLQDYFAK